MVEGKFDVALLPPGAASDDVTTMYQYFLTNEKSPLSYARHKDTRIDKLWEAQTRELDPLRRKSAPTGDGWLHDVSASTALDWGGALPRPP